ncbi:MAG: hypothetical protein C0519_09915 [Hyphomicrobium sp.]|nr:hypothetical protein [Hyphomicrobium sp.]PPD08333.1 MAG: hypothetical protein CTY28_05915 [Hyphomicrobium sp.]
MLSILTFSGKHWSRAALGWILFAVAVDGLAKAGAEAADAKLAAYNAAVALGVQDEGVRLGGPGQYQVAKVSLKDLDLKAIDPSVFADAEETGTPSR